MMKSDIIKYAAIVRNGLIKPSDTIPNPNNPNSDASGAADGAASKPDVPQIKFEAISRQVFGQSYCPFN